MKYFKPWKPVRCFIIIPLTWNKSPLVSELKTFKNKRNKLLKHSVKEYWKRGLVTIRDKREVVTFVFVLVTWHGINEASS